MSGLPPGLAMALAVIVTGALMIAYRRIRGRW